MLIIWRIDIFIQTNISHQLKYIYVDRLKTVLDNRKVNNNNNNNNAFIDV